MSVHSVVALSLGLLLVCSLGCTPYRGGGGGGDDDDAEDDDDAADDDGADDDDGSDDDDAADDDDGGGCPGGEIEDCDGVCAPAEWVGDGYCDDETYEWPDGSGTTIDFNCAEFDYDGGDCSAGDDDDVAPECTQHSQCDDDEFCWESECELIFGRSFEVTFVGATADQFDENGNNWDVADAPDMYGVVKLDGSVELTTPTVDDSLVASWGADVDLTLTPTSLCFVVYDEDLSSDDEMDDGCLNGQSGIVSGVRDMGYSGDLYWGLVEVEIAIQPNF